MKKRKILITTLLMIVMLSIPVFANGDKYISNLFLFDKSSNVTSDVEGDVYAFGRGINIKSAVGGDIISAGQDISVKSDKVLGNIRIAGQNINIDVKDTKNITVAGQNINIKENTNSNAIYVTGQNINFNGITNDASIAGQKIVIDGTVKKDLNLEGEDIIITENTKLDGKVNIKSPNEPNISGDTLDKDINYEEIVYENNSNYKNNFNLVDNIMSIITAVILGLILFLIFKNYFYGVEKNVDTNIGKFMLVGLGILIVAPVLMIVLFMSVIGIPIGFIVLMLYILGIYLSPVVTGITLGQRLLKGQNPYIQVIAGILGIKLLLLVPYIEVLAMFICIMFTLGTISVKIIDSINLRKKAK